MASNVSCNVNWAALRRALRVWKDMVHWPAALPELLDPEAYDRGPAAVLGLLQARLSQIAPVPFAHCAAPLIVRSYLVCLVGAASCVPYQLTRITCKYLLAEEPMLSRVYLEVLGF